MMGGCAYTLGSITLVCMIFLAAQALFGTGGAIAMFIVAILWLFVCGGEI